MYQMQNQNMAFNPNPSYAAYQYNPMQRFQQPEPQIATLIPSGALGNTWYGTTPEERTLIGKPTADVSIVNTGVAVAISVSEDPVQTKTTASEIVLPSYERMDSTYVIKCY